MRRILLALLIALGLSPGLFWRGAPPRWDNSQSLALIPLAIPKGAAARIGGEGGPVVTGAWQMASRNSIFGSYSALLAPGDGTLLALSDHGNYLRFPMPGAQGTAQLGQVQIEKQSHKWMRDMESATRDPAGGHVWIGFEGRNAIIRYDADLSHSLAAYPAAMRHWKGNGGPEAMVRLTDGRFVVLAESALEWDSKTSPGLVFPGDPAEGAVPAEFRFAPPPGYFPSDMAQLPDGRVLIVLRGVQLLPPRFTVKLALADPARIRPGETWAWREVGEIAPPLPVDNYEGLAITGGKDGGPLTLWIVSDDNEAQLFQRSLLLRLEWQVPPPDAEAAKR